VRLFDDDPLSSPLRAVDAGLYVSEVLGHFGFNPPWTGGLFMARLVGWNVEEHVALDKQPMTLN
jgi:hypothetical protein